MNTDWHDLIQRYLAGRTTDDETDALQAAMKSDAKLRALYLDYMNLDVSLEAAAGAMEMAEPSNVIQPPPRRWSAWTQWRPQMAAAAGVVFGMFCTSMVWAYVGPWTGKVTTLWQESFESGVTETAPSLPREAGVWSGDEAHVVQAANGLKPKSGTRMLRFVSATFAGENAKQSAWGDVYRLVDLRGRVDAARAVLRLSASFDASRFSADEEYAGSVELCALEEDVKDLPQPLTLPRVRENSVSTALRKMSLKGDGGWQAMAVEVPVTAQTRYVLVHVSVLRRKPYPPTEPVRFSGHYVDDVQLELISPSGPR